MRIGVIELLGYKARTTWEYIEAFGLTRQFASITPQAISVWCRQMGHQVFYTTYWGMGDLAAKLPKDLDVLFVGTHTPTAPLAYALSQIYKTYGTRTVIGGPHTKSFPESSQCYFDIVVLECNQGLIADIINDQFPPGSIVSSKSAYIEPPTVEERMPEIKKASFVYGRAYQISTIPLLASMGCPYTCDFCADWNTPYRPLSNERLAEDLLFISKTLPGTKIAFHDANFAIRFDEVMAVMEKLSTNNRPSYGIQTSLGNLKPKRLKQLKETNCIAVFPSIESWTETYSHKLGEDIFSNDGKVTPIVNQFKLLNEYIPYVATNFIFGLDHDSGSEPFELTKEFIRQAPFVWPRMHIPVPIGGTPMFNQLLSERRILPSVPFMFCKDPYLTIVPKNYSPTVYIEHLANLFSFVCSNKLLRQRMKSTSSQLIKTAHYLRTIALRKHHQILRTTLELLLSDPTHLAFHCGETNMLPAFYITTYNKLMGKYAQLVPIENATRPLS